MRVSPPTRRARATRLLAASALAAAAVLAAHPSAVAQRPAAAASTSKRATVIKIKVDPRMFGVHDAYWNSLRRAGTGAIRLWDAGVQWPDLFPTQGTLADTQTANWTRLDQVVQRAHANGTEVTLVLGLTPSYAAPTPTSPNTSAPDPALYDDYVRAVMSRYSAATWGCGTSTGCYRGIAAYQVWNESNIETFWTGTYDELAGLVKTVYDARNAIDPGVKVIAPAMVTRLGYQRTGIKNFFSTKVDGVPVWKYVDAISLNLYPTDTVPVDPKRPNGPKRPGVPEDSMALLATVKAILADDGVPRTLPIWNTEINYGLHTGTNAGTSAKQISNARQVAYVMRTFLLNAARGVKRVDWYAYDLGNLPSNKGGLPIGNTLLTDPDDRPSGTLTPAGRAFTRVQSWMKGTLVGTTAKRPCSAGSTGTYTCVIRYASGVGRVYWNPWRTVDVKLAASATKKVSAGGTSSKVQGGSTIKIGYQPVLVRSAR